MTLLSPLLKKTTLTIAALLTLVAGATAALAEVGDGSEEETTGDEVVCLDTGADGEDTSEDDGTGEDEGATGDATSQEEEATVDESTLPECDDDEGEEAEDEEAEGEEADAEEAADEADAEETADEGEETESQELVEVPETDGDEEEFANHGAAVSQAAHECEPGPGHGACVSEVARSNAGKPHAQDADDPEVGEESDDELPELETESSTGTTDATPNSKPGKGNGADKDKGAPKGNGTRG